MGNRVWLWVLLAIIIIGGLIYFSRGTSQQTTPPTTTPTTTQPTPSASSTAPTTTQAPQPKVTQVQFVNHLQANLPEQDVFVEDGANKVVRVEGTEAQKAATLAKKVYAAATMVAHDPFKVGKNPLGPFPKGKALGFTLKDWLAATGTGTYTVTGDKAQMDLSFSKLVPNGVYTVWCSRITFPPKPNVVDRPCGAADGSQNSFKADTKGNATFKLSLAPLEPSTKETASAIALAYHSNGKTYGAEPGKFGFTTHVQTFFLVPAQTQQ